MRTNLYGTAKQVNKNTPKSYRTIEDVTLKYKGYGEITIPKGTLVTNTTASGPDDNYLFVSEYEWITKQYPSFDLLLKFDAEHYGIQIPKDKVEQI